MGGLPISCKGIDFDIMEDKVFIINRNGMKTEFSYFDVSNHIKDYVDIGYCSGMNVIQNLVIKQISRTLHLIKMRHLNIQISVMG